jgi:hypothetical protein
VAAELQRRGDVDSAIEGALHHPPGQRRLSHRLRGRAPQRRGLAQPGPVRERDRDHPGHQSRRHRRALGDGAKRPQHAIGIDAGGVDAEDEDEDHDQQPDLAPLRQGLEGDVGVAEHGHVPAPDQHRVAAVADEGVDDDHHDQE